MNTTTLPLFEKRTVAELSEIEMMQVNGGSTPVCTSVLYSSEPCAIGLFLAIAYIAG